MAADPSQRASLDEELIAEVKQRHEMVEQLCEVVNRNSQNSSQPPAQDRPDQKPDREPSGSPRKRGGQPGHPGQPRTLVDEVDPVIVDKPIRKVGPCYKGKTQHRIVTK